jgi:hypothetical protein
MGVRFWFKMRQNKADVLNVLKSSLIPPFCKNWTDLLINERTLTISTTTKHQAMGRATLPRSKGWEQHSSGARLITTCDKDLVWL